jgi:hypothetical protein
MRRDPSDPKRKNIVDTHTESSRKLTLVRRILGKMSSPKLMTRQFSCFQIALVPGHETTAPHPENREIFHEMLHSDFGQNFQEKHL